MPPRLSEAVRRVLATGDNHAMRYREPPHGRKAPEPVDYSASPHRPSRFWRSFTFTDPFHGIEERLGMAAGIYHLAYPGHEAAVPGGPLAAQLPFTVRRNLPRGVYLPTQEWNDAMATAAPGQEV